MLGALRQKIRDQSSGLVAEPSEYMEGLLTSLDDRDITHELFDYALGLAPYAPTAANIIKSFTPDE